MRGPEMTPSEPTEVRIRNQRCRPYWELLQGMLVATTVLATIGLFFAWPIEKLSAVFDFRRLGQRGSDRRVWLLASCSGS